MKIKRIEEKPFYFIIINNEEFMVYESLNQNYIGKYNDINNRVYFFKELRQVIGRHL